MNKMKNTFEVMGNIFTVVGVIDFLLAIKIWVGGIIINNATTLSSTIFF